MIKKTFLCTALVLMLLGPQTIWAWSSDPTVNTPICTDVEIQKDPAIVHDDNGGAIIVWGDLRDQRYIYAQAVDAAGNISSESARVGEFDRELVSSNGRSGARALGSPARR